MPARRRLAVRVALLTTLLVAGAARAEQVAPFVVSPQRDVARMMALADVGPADYLVDLGSGDGRIVIAAGRRGALAHGVDIDPALVARARDAAEAAGVDDRVAFFTEDLFESDFRHATVVTLYLFPDANLQLRPLLLEQLRPGTRVLSNSFDMGDWIPDERVEAATSGGILLWIVPADVGGEWDLRIGGERVGLRLFQRYQEIGGDWLGTPERRLEEAALRGERITFTVEGDGSSRVFSGTVDGNAMTGFVQRRQGGEIVVDAWTALRAPE